MSEDIMLMEMPGAFEREQHGFTRPDEVLRVGNAQSNGRQWRSTPLGVVLTGYRLLTTIVIVGIGIPKAVYSYYGQSLVSPSLDWVGGIIFALLLFWLGVIEATRPELCPRFFEVDLAPTILGLLGLNDTPSPLDPASMGSLHRDNTLPLVPPTLGSPRRGDTSLLAPEIQGVLSDDTSPPLIPEIPGVLGRADTSPPLAAEILGVLYRADTPPAFSGYPPSSSNSSSPMSRTVQLAGTTAEHQNITPSKPGSKPLPSRFAMQRRPQPFARSWHYFDVNEREPEVDLTDLRDEEWESRPEETSRTSSYSQYQTVARIRRAPPQERARASASRVPPNLPDVPCRLCGDMSPRHNVERFGGFCSERHKSEWESYTRRGRGPPQEMARASASRTPPGPNLPDVPCRICGLMNPRHNVEHFGEFCSERHKFESELYPSGRGVRGPPQEVARASASRAPPAPNLNPSDVPCRVCGLMNSHHNGECSGEFCSERHSRRRHGPPQECQFQFKTARASLSVYPSRPYQLEPPNLSDLRCRLCGLMGLHHNVERFGGSERHKSEWERDHSYPRRQLTVPT